MRNGPRTRTTLQLTYVNRKGETVQIEISGHARSRFRERWQSAFPGQPLPEDFEVELQTWFAKARRTEPTSRKYQTRLRRYGKDTLYFYAHPFMFVIQSAMLRTVELASRDTRPLNKPRLNNGAHSPSDHFPLSQPDSNQSTGHVITESGEFLGTADLVAESVCEVTPRADDSPRSYRLLGGATDEDRKPKFIGLGTYPVDGTNGDARLLPAVPEFLPEVRERFRKKRPGWILLTIYATLGKHGEQIRIYDEVPS